MLKIIFLILIINIISSNIIEVNNSSLIELTKNNKFVLVFNKHGDNKNGLWQFYLCKYKLIKNYYTQLFNVIIFAIKEGKEDSDVNLFINGNKYSYHGKINYEDLFDYYSKFIYKKYENIYLKSLLQQKKSHKHFIIEFNEQFKDYKKNKLDDYIEILSSEFMNFAYIYIIKSRFYDSEQNIQAKGEDDCISICIHNRSKLINYKGYYRLNDLRNFILYEYIILNDFKLNDEVYIYLKNTKLKFYLSNTNNNLKEIYKKNYFKNKLIFYIPSDIKELNLKKNNNTNIYEAKFEKNKFEYKELNNNLNEIIDN